MDLFKAKFIALLSAVTLITGGGIGLLLYYLFPEYYPQWYGCILVFFFSLELIVVQVVDAGSKKFSQIKLTNLYMMIKVAKMLLSLVFIGIAMIVKEGMKSFALVFIVFYFIYMLFETYYLSQVERQLKEKKKINI